MDTVFAACQTQNQSPLSKVLACAALKCGAPCLYQPMQQMTYVKQLEAYEEAVMRKRVEEMTEDELNELVAQSAEARQAKGPKQ